MKKIVNTTSGPQPIGPYSKAVIAGNMLFTSGNIALNDKGELYSGGNIKEETRLVLENLKNTLHAAGSSFNQVVKTSIFIADMGDFVAINEVYATYFENNYPARETVQVSRLPKDARIEISMIALVNQTNDNN